MKKGGICIIYALLSMPMGLVIGQTSNVVNLKFPFYKLHNPQKVKYLNLGDQININLHPISLTSKTSFDENTEPGDSGSINIGYSGYINNKNDSILSIRYTGETIQTDIYTPLPHPDSTEIYVDMRDTLKYMKYHKYFKKYKKDEISNSNGSNYGITFKLKDTGIYSYTQYQTATKTITYYCDSIVNINFNKIDYVLFDKAGNFTDNSFNVLLIAASFLSALVVAPAASINYAHGGFDYHRYYNIMIPSLTFFTVDFTLYMILNRERKYKVKCGIR